jgi:hypothetical protein
VTVRVLFANATLNLKQSEDVLSVPQDGNLADVFASIRDGQRYLEGLDVDDIIGFFNRLCEVWGDRANPIQSRYGTEGLNFLLYWFRQSHLTSALDVSLRGDRKVLDDFVAVPGSAHSLIARPRGVICHWLAGNVPTLGMLSLAQGMLTKNANIVKVSKRNGEMIPHLLSSFNDVTYETQDGRVVEGKELVRSVAAVYVDHDDSEAQAELSQSTDVRVAWGGREAVESVMNLPRRYGTEDVIFGPKTSFMVIGKEVLGSEASGSKIARRASVDASLFDQLGCNSPHTVFVETGSKIDPGRFAELLAVEMERTAKQHPRREFDSADTMRILRLRAEYDMRGQAHYPQRSDWTVLYSDDDEGLATPCFNRTVFVRPIRDAMDVEQFCSHLTQSVGVALSADRKAAFAKRVMARGVDRCPEVGTMTLYEVPWDGIFAMDRFVRWCTIQEGLP